MDMITVEDSESDHRTDKYLPLLIKELNDICIFFLTLEGHIASWSGACDHVKEYSREEIVGKHYRILFPQRLQDEELPEREIQLAIKHGKYLNYDWRRRKSGEEFWAYVILLPLYDDKKQILGFAKITQDLTRDYQIKKELLAINQKLNEFAYITAHDLKAPLRNVKTLVDILMEDKAYCLEEEQTETLFLLGDTVKKMSTRIDDILKYAKSSIEKSQSVKIDLQQLVKEVVEFVKPGNHVKVNISPQLPSLDVPATALFQVFQNLIDNAIKYNDKDQVLIDIDVETKNDEYRFSICDNGPGIEKKDYKRIFKLFNKATENNNQETGIGLAVVEKIISSLGGDIWVTSQLKKGSTFHFTIPSPDHKVVAGDFRKDGE